MKSEWLSESVSEGAISIILLSPLPSDKLLEASDKYPLGVLWFSPPSLENTSLPENIKQNQVPNERTLKANTKFD